MTFTIETLDAMGALTEFLQESFAASCPLGWSCRREVQVLDGPLAELFGYAPKADVSLERGDGLRRLWIEFEVSRADPVANHAKFATAHLFQPQRSTETYVSMMSWHVAPGRRNLAANTISLMRHVGMSAFQTTLFPGIPPDEVRRLNHLEKRTLAELNLEPSRELARALEISEPLVTTKSHRIYFASDLLDVLGNVRSWNRWILTETGGNLWGHRRVRYFVFDRKTKLFAPSKFCAFLPLSVNPTGSLPISSPTMTIELYASLNEDDPRFDGNRAWRHLRDHLGMTLQPAGGSPELSASFQRWLQGAGEAIQVDARGAQVLCPPKWLN